MMLNDKNRLSIGFPNLCKEWDDDKNYPLVPTDVSFGSGKKVWWKCGTCQFEWLSRIRTRTSRENSLCPRCARRKAGACKITKHKKFILNNHQTIALWNWERNISSPTKISCESHKIVWWKCDQCGNEWKATVKAVHNGFSKCLKCKSISYRNPELVPEWMSAMNLPLSPENTTYGYNKRVWWKCQLCSFEWLATPNNRTSNHSGCPNCRKKIVLKDGFCCDSILEAYYYILLKESELSFECHGLYGKELGKRRYDFYLPSQNLYVEVTSFDSTSLGWKRYIAGIEKKKDFVKNILHANFDFIQCRRPTSDIFEHIRKYIK